MSSLHQLYDLDINEWINLNIQLLRERRFSQVDVDHLVEELEEMGKSNIRELRSLLVVLIAHLLKWQFQPDMRSRSWRGSITEQRVRLKRLLNDAPSLGAKIPDSIPDAYADALIIAVEETGLAESLFPEVCAYSIAQLLDRNYYPEG